MACPRAQAASHEDVSDCRRRGRTNARLGIGMVRLRLKGQSDLRSARRSRLLGQVECRGGASREQ